MDPVGSWSAYAASYNRLTGAAGSNGEFPHHLAATNPAPSPSTTSPLLLQAAHATPSPAFTHGSFLSPPPVGYDAVFSPFLHHANQKVHYTQALNAAQHRQAIATAKQGSAETDSLRENYNPVHPQALPAPNPAFFDQASGTVQPSTIAWTHQGNSQLPSPFGILPHESVVGNSPSGPTTKLPYENFNAAHFAAAQTLNHINSQLVAVSYSDATKRLAPRPVQSPPSKNITPTVTTSPVYYQQNSPGTSSQFIVAKTQASTTKSDYCLTSKVYATSGVSGSVQQTQTHNVMSTSTSSKDYNISQPQIQSSSAVYSSRIPEKSSVGFQPPTSKSAVSNSPVPSKIVERRDSSHDSTQSSPISYAIIDSNQHRSTSKVPSSRTGITVQQSQLQQQQLLNHQKSVPYRGFSSSTGSTPESEYNQGTGGRNTSSTDGGYSSGSSVGHIGVDTALQRSPLDSHVTSPASYPIYHSPMTSMSSPSPVQHPDQNGSYKQNPSPQITPTSPLDASLPRHSSVITRSDQNYPNERNVEYPQKQCWEGTEQLRSSKYSGYPAEVSQSNNNIPIQQQRTGLLGSDRQQGYFDSSSKNLISNKGDPMTIVKNLQNLQQQVQASSVPDVKPVCENSKPVSKNSGSPTKRKKSIDTKAVPIAHPDSLSRVPPPAHLNTNQPQQNGGYAEYDRWNTQQSQKVFNGNPNTFGNQSNLHPNANLVNPAFTNHTAQQAVSQVPYYPPHNLPVSHDEKYINPDLPQNSAVITDSVPCDVGVVAIPKVEDSSVAKVIVPDVEEELGFLAETPNTVKSKSNEKNVILKPPVVKKFYPCPNQNDSFMASYIKFLQGEKESSPPPKRNTLKTTYIPLPKKAQVNNETNKQKKSNKSPTPSPTPDFEDDPRYFPLPKDPSSRKLGSSSDSEGTDYDNLIPKTTHRPSTDRGDESTPITKSNQRIVRRSSKTKNKSESARRSKRKRGSSSEGESEEELPKRKTSKRKAKERIKCFEDNADELYLAQSDSDTIWTPVDEGTDDDDEYTRKRSSRGKRKPSKPKKPPPSRFLESSDEENAKQNSEEVPENTSICSVCSSSFVDDPKDFVKCSNCKKQYHGSCCSLQSIQRLQKLKSKRNSWKCDDCKSSDATTPPPSEKKTSSKKKSQSRRSRRSRAAKFNNVNDSFVSPLGNEEYFPFKSGEFIVVKSDLKEDYPSIWRVDGKTLLQKYEPFDQNGEKLYRNISTYSGWTPQNKDIYQKIPVQFIVQSRFETIVRFLRSEMVDPAEEQAFLDQSLNETGKYQDNFEVYIQTLISQALDSNFLAEIFAEKDEYFLQNVEVIDRLTEERRLRLIAAVDWPLDNAIQQSVTTWPCYNVLADLRADSTRLCDACERSKVHARIILYGQPYNPTTLDGMTPDSSIANMKDFMICLECIKYVQLYNKLVHQKYIMYIECAKRVAEKRSTDRSKDTTVILNELLADEEWLNRLFRQVRMVWADVERAEREKKRKLGIPVVPQTAEEKSSGENKVEQEGNDVRIIAEKELVKEIKVERDYESGNDEPAVEDDSLEVKDHVVEATSDSVTVEKIEEESRGQMELSTTGLDESVTEEQVCVEKIPKES